MIKFPIEDWPFDVVPVGSRVSCDPPPTDTDQDWLTLVDEEAEGHCINLLIDNQFVKDGAGGIYQDSRFNSWRKDEDNIIMTKERKFYDSFLRASRIATEKNLLDKNDRIALFQEIMGGPTLNNQPVNPNIEPAEVEAEFVGNPWNAPVNQPRQWPEVQENTLARARVRAQRIADEINQIQERHNQALNRWVLFDDDRQGE